MRFSEKRTLEKRKKFEKELRAALSNINSEYLREFSKNFIEYLDGKGTSEHFIQFLIASKFGDQNAHVATGTWLSYVIGSFNQVFEAENDGLVNAAGFLSSYVYSPSIYGHSFVEYAIEGKYLPFITKINREDYYQAVNISPNLFLDKQTNAFGFVITPYILKHKQVLEWRADKLGSLAPTNKIETDWQVSDPPVWAALKNFSTGPLEYTSGFTLLFGSLEELLHDIPEREKIGVQEYQANRWGKEVTIRSHTKRKPIRGRKLNELISDHIVYKVYDHENRLRYIGEGRPNRPEHVFSGASHNPKINEHYFLQDKPMRVEIVAKNLTKSDALAIERLLLLKHSHDDLWNTKDYYPSAEIFTKSIDEANIIALLDQIN